MRLPSDRGGGGSSYTYDWADNLVETTDANFALLGAAGGYRTRLWYDRMGRVTLRQSEGPHPTTTTYLYGQSSVTGTDFPQGVLTEETVTSPTSSTTVRYRHDYLGRVTEKIISVSLGSATPDTAWFTYTYRRDGLFDTTTIRRGTFLENRTYEYDAWGRATGLDSDVAGAIVASASYALDERLTEQLLGNGLRVQRSYRQGDPSTPLGDLRLDAIWATTAAADTLLKLGYGYDPVGNVTRLTVDGERRRYSYDSLNRLTEFFTNDQVQALYRYDRLGNRTEVAHYDYSGGSGGGGGFGPMAAAAAGGGGGPTIQYTYSAFGSAYDATNTTGGVHALTCRTTWMGDPCLFPTEKYAYDHNGNQVLRVLLGATQDTTVTVFNDRNKIRRRKTPITEVHFEYGPSGEKIATIENGVARIFFDAALEVVGGSPITYYFANGNRIASRDTTGTEFLVSDHLGSTRLVTDGTGTLQHKLDYSPWGSTTTEPSVDGQLYVFNGNSRDVPGILDYNARSYEPGIGVMLQADVIVPDYAMPQSLNRYSYVVNNPQTLIDPTGHLPMDYGGKLAEALAQAAYDDPETAMWIALGFVGAAMGPGLVAAAPQLSGIVALALKASDVAEVVTAAVSGGPRAALEVAVIDAALGPLDEAAAVVKKSGGVRGWLKRIFGKGDEAVGGTQSALEVARAGGRHAGQLRQFMRQTPNQLKKSIASFEKNIAKHEGWIKDPTSKVANWAELSPQHQQRVLHHWRQDIARAREYKSMAEGVLGGL